MSVATAIRRPPSPLRRPARRPKTQHSRSELPIIRLRPCVPPAISPQAKRPVDRGRAVLVDHEPAVLVVEHGIREDRLGERIDPGRAVAAQHVRKRDLGVLLRDLRRVEPDRGAPVRGLDAASLAHLVDDRLGDLVARAELVGEVLAVLVQELGAVGARRLGDRVARRPWTARRRRSGGTGARRSRAPRRRGRARSRSSRRSRRDGSSSARRAPRPRGSSGRRRRGRPRRPRARARRSARASRSPSARARRAATSGTSRRSRPSSALAQRRRDREPRLVAHLEEPLARGAAAAREAVAAVLARELDAVLLEPADRGRAPPR